MTQPIEPSSIPSRIRLSHSALEVLDSCERKFQLERLLSNGAEREESEHFAFGHAFGTGIAAYLKEQSTEAALFEAWIAYWPIIETEKKNLTKCIAALQVAFFRLDDILQDYELATFNGVPATELSFKIDIDEEFYYVGYIDAVLRNRYSGTYVVFEVKTTGLLLQDLEPLYKHSGQALGYSIALDEIAGTKQASYGVIYFVAQLHKDHKCTIHTLDFNKTLLDRLNWFITLGLDVDRIKKMRDLAVFPKRVSACLRFNRPCRHFGICELHGMDRAVQQVEDLVDYQFTYDIKELVEDHLNRVEDQFNNVTVA